MKYLDSLIAFIGRAIKWTFKLLTKIPPSVIEWSIIALIVYLLAAGIYTVITGLF